MKTLRILYALQGFPPRQNGGTEWETHRRARWLVAHGHMATVVAVDRKALDLPQPIVLESEHVDGIPVTRLSVRTPCGWGDVGEYDDPLIYRALHEMLCEIRPDILHVASGYQMTAAAVHAGTALGIPVVLTATDFWLVCPRVTLQRRTGERCRVPDDPLVCVTCLANDWRRYRLIHSLTHGASTHLLKLAWRSSVLRSPGIARIHTAVVNRRVSLARAIEGVDCVIVASQFLEDVLAHEIVPADKLVVMRQGLDMHDWLASESTPRTTLNFGFVGQIAEHKGVFDVIEAYLRIAAGSSEVRDTRLLIYGEHERSLPAIRDRLLHLTTNRPDIVLMGRFDNREIRQVHAQLDVLVVPSRWYENSPNVILEAFACRTPVITSHLGGMAELVDDGVNGWLVPPGDVTALAKCMNRIAEAPSVLLRLKDGMPPVRTIDDEMDELADIYGRIRNGIYHHMVQS